MLYCEQGGGLSLIERVESGPIPLSYAQMRLWFIEQYEGGTDVYHIPLLWALDVSVDVGVFKAAIQEVIQRHAILRTHFVRDAQGVDHQVITEMPFLIHEACIASDELEGRVREALHRPFDLTAGHPLRMSILTMIETGERYVVAIVHHIAFDGWSRGVFMEDLTQCYRALMSGSVVGLPELGIQYHDFSVWQHAYLSGDRLTRLERYWQAKLASHELLAFPTDYARPAEIDYRGGCVSLCVTRELSERLKAFSRREGVTLYTTLLSGLAITLWRYTGQTDLLIGTPVLNRQHPQLSGLIGFFCK